MSRKNKDELNKKRQLLIANSLYELGIEDDVIRTITNVEMNDILNYRLKIEKKAQEKKEKLDS